MELSPNIKEAVCVICNKPYFKRIKGYKYHARSKSFVRGSNTITCSKKCSRENIVYRNMMDSRERTKKVRVNQLIPPASFGS